MHRSVKEFWGDAAGGVVLSIVVIFVFGLIFHTEGCVKAHERQFQHDVLVSFRTPGLATHRQRDAANIISTMRILLDRCPTDSATLVTACRDIATLARSAGPNLPRELGAATLGKPSAAYRRLMDMTGYGRDELFVKLTYASLAWNAEPASSHVLTKDDGSFVRAYLGRITPAEIPTDEEVPFVPRWFWLFVWCCFGVCTVALYWSDPGWVVWSDLRDYPWKQPGTWASFAAVLPGIVLAILWSGLVDALCWLLDRRKRRRAAA